MKLTIDHMKLLDKKKVFCLTFSILASFCLFSTLFIDTALAQLEMKKFAIIFRELHVINSHGDCANWILWANVYYHGRGIPQIIADGCFHSGGNYPLRFPVTAIVDQFPYDVNTGLEWRGLSLYGVNQGWFGDDRLAERHECCLRIPNVVEYRTAEVYQPAPPFVPATIVDYSVTYQIINCQHPVWLLFLEGGRGGTLCSQPPGQYYQYPRTLGWWRGIAPSQDLEGFS
jgi:hypothetical protein